MHTNSPKEGSLGWSAYPAILQMKEYNFVYWQRQKIISTVLMVHYQGPWEKQYPLQ